VITETKAKATLHQRAMHELKELIIISLYLYITLGAVILMKAAVLHTEGIAFAPWGIAIVKAVVLAKFMLLGHALKIGERTTTSPLIWPTLHKAFAFLGLLIIMTIIEEAVVGLFHHRSIAASLGELFGPRLVETIAGYLIMLLVLIPYFAFRVLDEVLGEGRLVRMFFVEREPIRLLSTEAPNV
jgi:predicted ferric reductase